MLDGSCSPTPHEVRTALESVEFGPWEYELWRDVGGTAGNRQRSSRSCYAPRSRRRIPASRQSSCGRRGHSGRALSDLRTNGLRRPRGQSPGCAASRINHLQIRSTGLQVFDSRPRRDVPAVRRERHCTAASCALPRLRCPPSAARRYHLSASAASATTPAPEGRPSIRHQKRTRQRAGYRTVGCAAGLRGDSPSCPIASRSRSWTSSR